MFQSKEFQCNSMHEHKVMQNGDTCKGTYNQNMLVNGLTVYLCALNTVHLVL